jgi:hypothetical protein
VKLATAHYRRFVELWRHADPASQPAVQRAKARLKALGG